MPLKKCEDCELQDDCPGWEDCPDLKKYDQAMAELKKEIPELMSYESSGCFECGADVSCLFCGQCQIGWQSTAQPIKHKPDCLGKRLLEIL